MARVGGRLPRPAVRPLNGRPLRVGYVGADFCQHTVGLFVKDVLAAHDPQRVQVCVYSAGSQNDWVTQAVRGAGTFHDVATWDDAALAAQIRADAIDVLVDLSGHTAGSRLTAFALRPAPVLVSWLGYFATTGLPVMDAILLDPWHAPPGAEAQCVEPVVRLPLGRFCYQPVPWAPQAVAPPAFERNGLITFGCFNNTAKLNDGVPDLSAPDAEAYVAIAAGLANNRPQLAGLRATLRSRMQASPLMDVTGFTRQLEDTLIDVYSRIESTSKYTRSSTR